MFRLITTYNKLLLLLLIQPATYSCKTVHRLPNTSVAINYVDAVNNNPFVEMGVHNNFTYYTNIYTIDTSHFNADFPVSSAGISLNLKYGDKDTAIVLYGTDSVRIEVAENGFSVKTRNHGDGGYSFVKKEIQGFRVSNDTVNTSIFGLTDKEALLKKIKFVADIFKANRNREKVEVSIL